MPITCVFRSLAHNSKSVVLNSASRAIFIGCNLGLLITTTSNYHLRKSKKHTLLMRFDFVDFSYLGLPLGFNFQRSMRNPVKHSRWSFLQKQLVYAWQDPEHASTFFLTLSFDLVINFKFIRKKAMSDKYKVHFMSTT